jgi:hypothetical protein
MTAEGMKSQMPESASIALFAPGYGAGRYLLRLAGCTRPL